MPQELIWIEDLLPAGSIKKHMFGGFAYYFENKLILCLFEDSNTIKYKKLKFNFAIWNGCLFPCDREYHEEILRKYPFLINHPVLSKWMYLPLETEDFEYYAGIILRQIRQKSILFGTIPKRKKKINPVKKQKINTRRPQMFSEEKDQFDFTKVQNISELKNLGPASEKAFKKAGIKTAKQFIKMGWKQAMVKLVKSDKKNRHSLFAYALIGALTNQLWNRISDIEKEEAKKFVKSLKK